MYPVPAIDRINRCYSGRYDSNRISADHPIASDRSNLESCPFDSLFFGQAGPIHSRDLDEICVHCTPNQTRQPSTIAANCCGLWPLRLAAQIYTSFSGQLTTTYFPATPVLTVSSQPLRERRPVLGQVNKIGSRDCRI